MPKDKDILNIVEGAKLADPKTTGFIISIKEKEASHKIIKDMNLPNVFISGWVPQKELLAQPKLKLFCTHGGANSMMESLYFGTPLLGFGQDGDQFGGIHRMKKIGVARFGFPDRSPEDIYNQIAEMLYDGPVAVNARAQAAKIMRLIEFEEVRQGNMMVREIDQTIKFGDSHLIDPSTSFPKWVVQDADIKLTLAIIFLLTLKLLKNAIFNTK